MDRTYTENHKRKVEEGIEWANYMIDNKCGYRDVAEFFHLKSHSMVHYRLFNVLANSGFCDDLLDRVREILRVNKDKRKTYLKSWKM